ncbi:hypothetical protein AncyloWKF20_19300 [Ancylobacter sp. WKF20]|uniref:hypothetical protein n=1 Tax=Ancylobacter sp. WKF20 TaxID=3039801 RepID=UPI00243440D5|nr:hypothetical protein [Ancylobacter sp. WKF20]WGD29873.1 hypothetical protein AncyloWKF20_19300 [Ancylobacter sp. WKF20]
MSDEKKKNMIRPTLPDAPDVSLSAALEYALYRDPDEVERVDERSFYRALNAAARGGKVRFWGFKHENLAFELEFGPKNIVPREIDPTYFAADDSAAMRGFDPEYNRINAFCFTESAEILQKILDEIAESDPRGYESYSNVRVKRDGFVMFVESIEAGAGMRVVSDILMPEISYAGVVYPNMPSAQSNKIRNAIFALWGASALIPDEKPKKEIKSDIIEHINNKKGEGDVNFSADDKTIRNTIKLMREAEG